MSEVMTLTAAPPALAAWRIARSGASMTLTGYAYRDSPALKGWVRAKLAGVRLVEAGVAMNLPAMAHTRDGRVVALFASCGAANAAGYGEPR